MSNEIFEQQLTFSLQCLEQLWQRAEKLPKPSEQLWQHVEEFPTQQQELLKESLEELSRSLQELQVTTQELHKKNEELVESRVVVESQLQYYQELFEFAPDGYLVTTNEGVILEANRAAGKLLNLTQKRLVGKPLTVFIAAEQRRDLYSKLNQLQIGQSFKNWLVPIQPRGGSCFWVSFTVVPVQNSQGQVVALHWRLLELASAPEKELLTGRVLEQEGKGAKETSLPNVETNPPLNHPITPSSESLFRTQNVSHLDQTSALNQLLHTEEQPLAVSVEQTGKLLNDVLSGSPDFFFICDQTGKYIYVNRTAAQVFGLAQSDFIGKTWQQLGLSAEIMERFDAQREAVFTTGQSLTDETSVATVEGMKSYEYTITRIRDINNDPKAVVVTVKDVTKYKQVAVAASTALAQEKETSVLKSHTAFVISQELRNLLHNIFAYVELIGIELQRQPNEKNLNYLQRIQVNIKRVNQLLDGLLWIGKTESKELQLNLALLDLSKFCRELTEELQQGAGRDHKITLNTQGKSSSVCMDPKLIRHILMNLLLNAIKYSPKGSEVKLEVVCHERKGIFRIQDAGVGMPQQEQELLFKAFHRESNVGDVAGSGSGLAFVKKCVDLQGGKICLENEEGVGTTFVVTLPLNLRQVRKLTK